LFDPSFAGKQTTTQQQTQPPLSTLNISSVLFSINRIYISFFLLNTNSTQPNHHTFKNMIASTKFTTFSILMISLIIACAFANMSYAQDQQPDQPYVNPPMMRAY
jgi:hypothetical protein